MITQQDLDAAILECQGHPNPNANTCIKLAAFYTIRNELFGSAQQSFSPGPTEPTGKYISYDSGTEFSEAIKGQKENAVWPIIDEAMTAISVTNPRLYASVIRKLTE